CHVSMREQFEDPPLPHHTPAFYEESAKRLVAQFGSFVDSYAIGNEPGDLHQTSKASGAPQDDISRDGVWDYIREDYFPNFVIPVVKGIRAANPNAIVSAFDADS